MTDEGPRLSFVIACYNGLPYLEECLASISRAALPAYEIVVVDDGSTQGIRTVVERHAPVTRYIRQENQGPAAARNTGIISSAGEYIAFLDADDLLLSAEALRAQVAMLDVRPEVGMVHAQALKVDARGRRFGLRRPDFARESYVRPGFDELADLLLGNYITTSTVVVRRAALDQAGLFRPEIPSGEDWDLWLRIARNFAVGHVAMSGVAYRIHGESITARNRVEPLLRVHLGIVARAFEDPEITGRFGPRRPEIEARMYLRAARRAYRAGDMPGVRSFARTSLQTGGPRQSPPALWLILRSLVPRPALARLRSASRRCKSLLVALRPA